MGFEEWQQENASVQPSGFEAWQKENTADEAPSPLAFAPGFSPRAAAEEMIKRAGQQEPGRKTMWEAIKHGWEVSKMSLTKGLAGLVKIEAEFSDHIPAPMGMVPPSKAYKELEKKELIEWTDGILEEIEIRTQENPELACN